MNATGTAFIEAHWTSRLPSDERAPALQALVGSGAEGWPYLRAVDSVANSVAPLHFLTLSDQGGPIGFAPGFVFDFNWLPSLKGGAGWPGWMRKMGQIRFAALGSAHANELGIRFDPQTEPEGRMALFERMLDGLEDLGRSEKTHMLMVKDVNARDAHIADPILRRRGYARMMAPPLAYLHLDDGGMAGLLGRLSRNRRSSIQKNLRLAADVEVTRRADVTGMADELHLLADATRARAKSQFGGLEAGSDGLFAALQKHAPETSMFTLYRHDGDLLGFSLALVDDQVLYAKTLGLNYPRALDKKVYFRIVSHYVEEAVKRGLEWLCLGQLGYETKFRFGAKLERRYYYLKPAQGGAFARYLNTKFAEGRSIESESAPFDQPENYFASDPDQPQPPAHLLFGELR